MSSTFVVSKNCFLASNESWSREWVCRHDNDKLLNGSSIRFRLWGNAALMSLIGRKWKILFIFYMILNRGPLRYRMRSMLSLTRRLSSSTLSSPGWPSTSTMRCRIRCLDRWDQYPLRWATLSSGLLFLRPFTSSLREKPSPFPRWLDVRLRSLGASPSPSATLRRSRHIIVWYLQDSCQNVICRQFKILQVYSTRTGWWIILLCRLCCLVMVKTAASWIYLWQLVIMLGSKISQCHDIALLVLTSNFFTLRQEN